MKFAAAVAAAPLLLSCSGGQLTESACSQAGGETAISAIFDVHWENSRGGIVIVRDSGSAGVTGGRIYDYTCSQDTCRKLASPPTEFSFANDGSGGYDSTRWIENTLVMATRWKITLATPTRFAFTVSTNGDCAQEYTVSAKPFRGE